jgi:pimeloyl-ACP methyl ester carboxylesterase
LALAAALPARVSALGIVAGLVPRQAYDDPAVRRAGAERLRTLELADTLPPDQLGEAMAPLLAPYPCDHALALEHQAEHRDPAGAHELASVAGGAHRMADALVEAVRHGLAGVAADVEAQARALDVAAVGCRTLLWYGSDDAVTPPAFGEWYARVLPAATLEVVPGRRTTCCSPIGPTSSAHWPWPRPLDAAARRALLRPPADGVDRLAPLP